MVQQIKTEFDPTCLPDWAQRNPDVVWLCERDLSFRGDVIDATYTDYRRFLGRQARLRRFGGDDY